MKHLLGETSAHEEEQVKQWIAQDPANLDYYNQLKKVWDTSAEIARVSAVDENKAWQKFASRVAEAKQSRNPFSWMKIAASIVLLTGLAVLAYFIFDRPNVKELTVTSQQTVLNDTLPDGSVVTLNKQASIMYPSKFTKNKRAINLKGEAFFNVTPDKKKPFIITANDVEITVVGTSFNVKTDSISTEVIVETGIVRVTKNGKTVELKAGERIQLTDNNNAVQKQEVKDHLYNYYRTKEFVCDDTPLWKLVEVINEAYGTNIIIGRNEIRDMQINTTFNNESLEQVLEVIRITFGIKVTRTGDQIILE